MTEDADLDRLVRDSLQQRAELADTTAPVLAGARAAVRRRRRRWQVTSGVLAASVVLGVVGAAVGLDSLRPEPVDSDGAEALDEPAETADWRTEYWHGVQVDVPADWGWGVTPLPEGARGVACGSQEGSYAGRPVFQTDVCTFVELDRTPESSYVWLGADLPAGSEDLGQGWVRETRLVAGATVSVASRSEVLREDVLDSVRPGTLCRTRLGQPPVVEAYTVDGGRGVRFMRVCAYRGDEVSGYDLVYAAQLGAAAGEDFLAATRDAPPAPRAKTCDGRAAFTSSYVVIRLLRDNEYSNHPEDEEYVVDLECLWTEIGPDSFRTITQESVVPWATGGIPAVVHAGGGGVVTPPWVYDYFIGPQG